ncbi:MAG TPA: SpoIIE family protein phosphatase [Candidatus Aquicultor sp.]
MVVEKSLEFGREQTYIDILSQLLDTGCLLSSKLTSRELNECIISEAKRVFDAIAFWIVLYDVRSDRLKMHSYWGPNSNELAWSTLRPDQGVVGRVFLMHRPTVALVAKSPSNPINASLLSDDKPLIAAFPLSVAGKKLGVLGFVSESLTKCALSTSEIEVVGQAFANQVAVALEMVRIIETKDKIENELKQSLRNVETLNKIGIDLIKDLDLSIIIRKVARYTTQILNADAAAVNIGSADATPAETAYFYNMPAGAENLLRAKHTICSTVFERPRRVVINDYPSSSWATTEFIKAGISCIAMVPVISRGHVLATISAISLNPEREFTDENVNELEFLANEMAVAIENASLYHAQVETREKIEAYAGQLQLLNDLSQNIIKEEDSEKMSALLADAARKLLNCSVSIVSLGSRYGSSIQRYSWSTDELNACMLDIEERDLSLHGGLGGEMYRTKRTLRFNAIADYPHCTSLPEGHPNVRGILGSPLLDSKNNFIGQIVVTSKNDGSGFNQTDEELLVALCAQVAIGIEKAEAYKQEHGIAEALQQAILAIPDSLPGLEVGSTYEAAGEVAKVGGDFYDLFELGDGRIGIVIGDVSGKGLKAATITSMVKSTVRAFAYTGLSPSRVITEANKVICRQLGLNQFITMLFGVLEPESGALNVCRAGHPEMVILEENSCRYCHMESNMPIGIFEDVVYEENEVSITPGQGIILYTDGLTEARQEKKILGDDGLIEAVSLMAPGLSAQKVANDLVALARHVSGGKQQDDIAIIVIRLLGQESVLV